MRKLLLALAALASLTSAGYAADMKSEEAKVSADMKAKITPAIITAIKAQNAANAHLDTAGILKLDEQWKSEISTPTKPLIDKILKNSTSEALRKIQAGSNGKYVELFITDNKGLNVGQTGMTSDYWQGDEPKFTKVFPSVGTYSEAPEFDESAQAYVGEVDGTITDAGIAIGAYTVKIKAK